MEALRHWSPDQQVGLLFVMVFGFLTLTTVMAVVLNVRDRDEAAQARWLAGFVPFRRELHAVWWGMTTFWMAWLSGALGATLLFGILSFLALREFITLQATGRGDHRTLLLAFFVVLPMQYVLVGLRRFDLFSVFIPVYAFLALPVISALSGERERFLERNAKIQWGVMVCVFGVSHAPALLLLEFPKYPDRGAFLVFFLFMVTGVAQMTQRGLAAWLRRRPLVRSISRSFSLRAWLGGVLAGGVVGAALFWITPFKPAQSLAMALLASGAGTLGEFVMQALKRDVGVVSWGNRAAITGAVGLLDRIAALAFGAPIFFHSVRWYFQLNP
jgi:phosphatidate cytidylyltransferase